MPCWILLVLHFLLTSSSSRNMFITSFLDTKFIKTSCNTILIVWYRKTVSSGRYLNFYSYHTQSNKTNQIKQIVNRLLSISDRDFHQNNLNTLISSVLIIYFSYKLAYILPCFWIWKILRSY